METRKEKQTQRQQNLFLMTSEGFVFVEGEQKLSTQMSLGLVAIS